MKVTPPSKARQVRATASLGAPRTARMLIEPTATKICRLRCIDSPPVSATHAMSPCTISLQRVVPHRRKAAGRRKSGCSTKLVAGRTQGRDSPFLACSSDVAIGEDSKPFVTWLLDLQSREGHRFRAAAEARGRSSEEPVAKPNAAATRRTLMLAMKSRRMRQYRPITCARSAAPRRTRRRSRASLPRNISTSHGGVSTTFQSCRSLLMSAASAATRMSSGECQFY